MSEEHVGYYSKFWNDCIPLSRVENIDPALGGVGSQLHKQVRVHYPDYRETDMSYEEFHKTWVPVFTSSAIRIPSPEAR